MAVDWQQALRPEISAVLCMEMQQGVLAPTGQFPELAVEMIGVGEQTGALPEMLNHVADFYDEDLDLKLTAMLSFVEPLV